MIKDITLSCLDGYVFDERTLRYLLSQIGALDRKIPRKWRKFISVKVAVKTVNKSHGNKYDMSVTLDVDGSGVTVHDRTSNVAALTDIVVAKLSDQLDTAFHF